MHDDEVQKDIVQVKDFIGQSGAKEFALGTDAAALADILKKHIDGLQTAARS